MINGPLQGMITSLRSKYTTSGYHHSRLITSWRESAYRIYAEFELSRQITFQIRDNGTYQICAEP